jgi:hypothetical protein
MVGIIYTEKKKPLPRVDSFLFLQGGQKWDNGMIMARTPQKIECKRHRTQRRDPPRAQGRRCSSLLRHTGNMGQLDPDFRIPTMPGGVVEGLP